MPEKPRSIMRLTASGMASVARGGDEKGEQRRAEHALVAQEIGSQREERAKRRRASPPPLAASS